MAKLSKISNTQDQTGQSKVIMKEALDTFVERQKLFGWPTIKSLKQDLKEANDELYEAKRTRDEHACEIYNLKLQL